MKVGILIDRLNVGGVEKIAIEEVRNLIKIGVDAELVVLRKKPVVNNPFPELLKNLPIQYLDDRMPNAFKFDVKLPMFHFFSSFHLTYPILLPIFIKKNEFDHLIVHGTYTALSAIAFKFCNQIRFSTFIWDPISYIVQSVYSKQMSNILLVLLMFVSRSMDKLILYLSDSIFVGGSAHLEYIRNIVGSEKVKVVPPSVYIHAPSKRKLGYCLLVTAWKTGKKPEFVFKIANKFPKLKIIMAGKWLNPEYKRSFQEQLNNRRLHNIELIGEVSEDRLIGLYRSALFFLQINDDRGFGLPALEAAGCGTTFIIPKNQGVCDLFENTIDGYFVEEVNEADIFERILNLTRNQNLATKMGMSAFSKVKKHYSWSGHVSRLIDGINQSSRSKK